jgi:hypothetical protein
MTTHAGGDEDEAASQGGPSQGTSEPGEGDIPAERPAPDSSAPPPRPGVPMSAEEYKELKQRAAEMPGDS